MSITWNGRDLDVDGMKVRIEKTGNNPNPMMVRLIDILASRREIAMDDLADELYGTRIELAHRRTCVAQMVYRTRRHLQAKFPGISISWIPFDHADRTYRFYSRRFTEMRQASGYGEPWIETYLRTSEHSIYL